MLSPGDPLPTWLKLADTPLTPEERFEIEFIRTIWTNSGFTACQNVSQVLDDVIRKGPDANIYVLLLRPVRDELNQARGEFEECFDIESALSFVQCTSRLVELIRKYVRAVSWMNQYLLDNPSYAEEGPYNIPLWEESHRQFATALQKDLGSRSRFTNMPLVFKKEGREILPKR